MTALFDEPLRVSLDTTAFPTDASSPEGFLLGFTFDPTAKEFKGIVVLPDGAFSLIPPYALRAHWRYQAEHDRWVDLDLLQLEQSDQVT